MCMDDPELLAEFVTESTDSLAGIENQLLAIEADGADIDSDLVNTVFRGVHSIKGVAGFLGLTTINQLSHCLEDVLNRIRNRELVPNSEIVDVMLKAADELSSMVAEPMTSNEIDVSDHLAALKAIVEDSTDEPDGEVRQEDDMTELAESTIEKAAEAEGTDTQPEPSTHESNGGANTGDSSEVASESTEPSTASFAQAQVPEVIAVAEPPAPQTTKSNAAKSERAGASVETSIRVPVSTLDHLMNLAGELVLNRNRLLQYSCDKSDAEFATLSSDIDHNTCELQEAIMQTRMQPIGTAFSRFPRIVRDLSSKLGKKCDLVVDGKDVEVDKSIIEAIGDPLTHLIRNSVDHGIELPEERRNAGKSDNGTIRLSAYHRAGQVCIDIEDNGGGIDADVLKQKAVSKDLISERQAAEMGAREALRLIFHPGFSTAEKLTDVSGRGVGMDVVRTNIERIGGTVDVESEVGSGTTIRIVLPLTLAIIRSLIISSHNRRFAIPQVNVAELVRISKKNRDERVSQINDAIVLRLRDDLVPLIDLRETLGLNECQYSDEAESSEGGGNDDLQAMNIVVLETGQSKYGVVVDRLHDSEEIVVKPLGKHLKKCRSFAGATILGDGRVALILDVSGIAGKAQVARVEENSIDNETSAPQQNNDLLRLLLFRNAPDEQFAVPMTQVARIERVATCDIEEFNGRLVTQYRGGTLPLLSIEASISATPRSEMEFVSVVVFATGNREYGLIAPVIEDICEVPVGVDTESLQEAGVLGSQVIGEVTTRILDVSQIYEMSYPAAAAEAREQTQLDDDAPKTVLIAEDSKFFRKRVVGFLEEAEYAVLEAEDGVEAWEILNREHIDLMVTDIEMPNMDGFELCKKVRAVGQFDNLPIVALTSLASDEDVRKVRECGVSDYQMKMDRDRLLNTIYRLLKASSPI